MNEQDQLRRDADEKHERIAKGVTVIGDKVIGQVRELRRSLGELHRACGALSFWTNRLDLMTGSARVDGRAIADECARIRAAVGSAITDAQAEAAIAAGRVVAARRHAARRQREAAKAAEREAQAAEAERQYHRDWVALHGSTPSARTAFAQAVGTAQTRELLRQVERQAEAARARIAEAERAKRDDTVDALRYACGTFRRIQRFPVWTAAPDAPTVSVSVGQWAGLDALDREVTALEERTRRERRTERPAEAWRPAELRTPTEAEMAEAAAVEAVKHGRLKLWTLGDESSHLAHLPSKLRLAVYGVSEAARRELVLNAYRTLRGQGRIL